METGVRKIVLLLRIAIIVAYICLLLFAPIRPQVVSEFWFFFPIGIFGAIIANSTGTGGGVVFVPIFNAIADGGVMLSEQARNIGDIKSGIIGMSFMIQCFGMSMGASVWLRTLFGGNHVPDNQRCDQDSLLGLIFAMLAAAIPTLLLTQWLVRLNSADVLIYFKLFSLVLGGALLIFALQHDRFAPKRFRRAATHGDMRAAVLIGMAGGIVTALFSVGVGEFAAVYLLLRRFPITAAVGIAVIVSAVCVLVGVWFHIASDTIIYEIVVWTIPGALIGGMIAGRVANILGAQKLKLFASLWIIASSVYLLLT